jgi:hypothetical protein
MGVATDSERQGEQVPPAGAWLFPILLLGTMAIQGNEQPHCCTKYKLTDVLYVPWAWH